MWRSDQHAPPALLLYLQQRRQQQRTLAQPRAIQQNLGQRTTRPPSTRQFGIERSKTTRDRRNFRMGKTVGRTAGRTAPAPDIGPRQYVIEGNLIVHDDKTQCAKRRTRPTMTP